METYVVAEQLIGTGSGGAGPLSGIRAACLSVLCLKLFKLQQKITLLVHDAEGMNQPSDVLFIPELLGH